MKTYDVIIIGAGAAGLMCAITAAKRGRQVILIDHANKIGKKILLSGGGRCNFTNRYTTDKNYLSANTHFCKSALKRYTANDFENLVGSFSIPYHEKTLGQLFCDKSSKEILQIFKDLVQAHDIPILLNTRVSIKKNREMFRVSSDHGTFEASSLVIATGGLSFPTMGASPFGYKVAEQFGIAVTPVRAGLVPLTLHKDDLVKFDGLAGVSAPVTMTAECGQSFQESMLFTHRGLSGPAVLQISSYWNSGETVYINWLPAIDVYDWVNQAVQSHPNKTLKALLIDCLPQSLVSMLCAHYFENKLLKQYNEPELNSITKILSGFEIKPNGTEGYRTAEVTLGGVDTNEISSKTFESKKTPGLFFIGEVLDVTGHLGGFNFQWAWSSGYCSGLYV
jgi:predicted Rossmann fold flavoprotein